MEISSLNDFNYYDSIASITVSGQVLITRENVTLELRRVNEEDIQLDIARETHEALEKFEVSCII